MPAQCLISFGSNLGDRHAILAAAAASIAATPQLRLRSPLKTSRLYETPPIGGPDGQEPFLNATGAFDTDASAQEILAALQHVEQELGRTRKQRWDARSIDLDVVLHGQLVGGGNGLIVPHPRYTARQFILVPACDVAAHYRDPRFGWTLKKLTEHLSATVPSMSLVGDDVQTRNQILEELTQRFGVKTFRAHPPEESMKILANAPASAAVKTSSRPRGETISETDLPWVSGYVPTLPVLDSDQTRDANVPRLVARIQRATDSSRWPAPHQMWPASWNWPEYRLEIDDIAWAVSEIASALQSMRCPLSPVTDDGHWW